MIYFFYPSRILGGAELLILRTAYFLKKAGLDITIVDIVDGWVSNESKNQKQDITLEYIYDRKVKLKDNSVLITTANFMFTLDDFFEKSNTKVIFWVVQPYNVVTMFPRTRLKKRHNFDLLYFINKIYQNTVRNRNGSIISEIINKNGIVAMDDHSNSVLNKYYGLNYKAYLPVFIETSNFEVENKKKIIEPIQAIWVGRVDQEFKIHILKKVISDLSPMILDNTIQLNVVGDGDGLPNLIDYCKKKNIHKKIKFLGTLNKIELKDQIKYMDIGFAMGTSAIDIASLKVPTVLLDFSYSNVVNYKYRWIFEAENFDLGRDISLLKDTDINKMKNIDQILVELRNEKENIGEKSYLYIINNHGEEQIFLKLKKYFNQVEFSISDVYNYRDRKPFWLKFRNNLHLKNRR